MVFISGGVGDWRRLKTGHCGMRDAYDDDDDDLRLDVRRGGK